MAARIPPPPVQPVYRFLGTALGASMWFFVCWSFGHEAIETIVADLGHIDLLQGKERRYLPPPDILAHARILLPPRKPADTTSQGRFFLVGSILGITRRETKRDRGRRTLARGSIVHTGTDTTHSRDQYKRRGPTFTSIRSVSWWLAPLLCFDLQLRACPAASLRRSVSLREVLTTTVAVSCLDLSGTACVGSRPVWRGCHAALEI